MTQITQFQNVEFTKPYWTDEVKNKHKNERAMIKLWLLDGQPRGMVHESYYKYTWRNMRLDELSKRLLEVLFRKHTMI